ncbi:MAG: 5-deoxy-glucuronate isomerase [Spirochaetaceae bacterium]|nr:5-deoxy-glucuronate isomerase [Spirochaetaceae bacterium]
MVLHKQKEYAKGLNLLVSDAENPEGLRLDFGIVSLGAGEVWEDSANRERALLLMKGEVRFDWDGNTQLASRASCFDENPEVLQLPSRRTVTITAGSDGAEICYEACMNNQDFDPVYYGKNDIRNDVFGAGTMNEASIRTVRTVFDGENAEFSNMVMGEVINHPGKWSSYPPHDHPHPEIYHYRMFPEQGFGVSLLDEQAEVVKNGSTSLIEPNRTHSQAAAPGYAMYYIWMIPHLPGDRWLPSTRYYRKEHEWLLEKNVKIWPERAFEESK